MDWAEFSEKGMMVVEAVGVVVWNTEVANWRNAYDLVPASSGDLPGVGRNVFAFAESCIGTRLDYEQPVPRCGSCWTCWTRCSP